MNRNDDPREPFTITERDLRDGFEAVMDSIERLSPREIDELRRQADSAELGHDAYAMGVRLLESGELDHAKHWLQKAVQYQVPGAQRALDELKPHSVVDTTPHDVREADVPLPNTASMTGATRSAAAFGRSDGTVAGVAVLNETPPVESAGGVVLPGLDKGLARGVISSVPGTIYALAITGGITVRPVEGRTVLFGRNRPEVHVCVGENDQRVSRQQGVLTHHDNRWEVTNTGKLPLRLHSRLLFNGDEPMPLEPGYTPLFVRGSGGREHLLELYVVGAGEQRSPVRHADPTLPAKTYRLSYVERLVLIALAQRYLLHESHPQPLSWRQTAACLADLQPDAGWTPTRAQHVVAGVRARLSHTGVGGLTRDEVGEPVGNTLNHNLIQELLMTTTLVPMDLALIDTA